MDRDEESKLQARVDNAECLLGLLNIQDDGEIQLEWGIASFEMHGEWWWNEDLVNTFRIRLKSLEVKNSRLKRKCKRHKDNAIIAAAGVSELLQGRKDAERRSKSLKSQLNDAGRTIGKLRSVESELVKRSKRFRTNDLEKVLNAIDATGIARDTEASIVEAVEALAKEYVKLRDAK